MMLDFPQPLVPQMATTRLVLSVPSETPFNTATSSFDGYVNLTFLSSKWPSQFSIVPVPVFMTFDYTFMIYINLSEAPMTFIMF